MQMCASRTVDKNNGGVRYVFRSMGKVKDVSSGWHGIFTDPVVRHSCHAMNYFL
jgi:hypothetical protein